MADAEQIVALALTALDFTVYPDEAPMGSPFPYFVYQAVGGQDATDLDNDPDTLQNQRVQVAGWSKSKAESIRMMQDARRALMGAGAKPLGAPVSVYETDERVFGRRLDFSIWYRE